MPFNFDTSDPIIPGLAAWVAGHNIAKANDKAQADLVKYQHNQAFANQIGAGIGAGVQAGFTQPIFNRIQNQQQLGFDTERANAMLPIEAQRQQQDAIIKATGMTPAQVRDQARSTYSSLPPELQTSARQQYNLPASGDLTDDHYLSMGTQMAQQHMLAQETAAKIQIAQAKQQHDQLESAWSSVSGGTSTLPPQVQAKFDSYKTALANADNLTPDQFLAAQQQVKAKQMDLLRTVPPNQIQPVVPPAKTFQEWQQGHQATPNTPYVGPDGVTHIMDRAGKWTHTNPPAQSKEQSKPAGIALGLAPPNAPPMSYAASESENRATGKPFQIGRTYEDDTGNQYFFQPDGKRTEIRQATIPFDEYAKARAGIEEAMTVDPTPAKDGKPGKPGSRPTPEQIEQRLQETISGWQQHTRGHRSSGAASGAATARPGMMALPPRGTPLTNGQIYQTSRGPARWNGSAFESAGQ